MSTFSEMVIKNKIKNPEKIILGCEALRDLIKQRIRVLKEAISIDKINERGEDQQVIQERINQFEKDIRESEEELSKLNNELEAALIFSIL
jgi:hypothetical protein